jgi:hypothetical protein
VDRDRDRDSAAFTDCGPWNIKYGVFSREKLDNNTSYDIVCPYAVQGDLI